MTTSQKHQPILHARNTIIVDSLGDEDDLFPHEYDITSYGIDYPVETLVRRLQTGALVTPDFQRSYVWDIRMASRFVESLLLGLPVPGVFLSIDPKDQSHLIIDGQQRLKTLQMFYEGVFISSRTPEKPFRLPRDGSRFGGLSYKDINLSDQRRLDNSVIHATIIRQDNPSEDQSSIYHIFERLNTGGKQLKPQEIRSALFHGNLVDAIGYLNQNEAWRSIYGPTSPDLRDQELIARFFAFLFYFHDYHSPMKTFINRYMARNRDLEHQSEQQLRDAFIKTIEFIHAALGTRAFRIGRALNAAVFEAVMVTTASIILDENDLNASDFSARYDDLLEDPEFIAGVTKATANETRVTERFDAAARILGAGR